MAFWNQYMDEMPRLARLALPKAKAAARPLSNTLLDAFCVCLSLGYCICVAICSQSKIKLVLYSRLGKGLLFGTFERFSSPYNKTGLMYVLNR
ncbi:hypothetical protein BpHYR1_027335 [Brachionus plicatilis]|uniref:Uncharacterized protein n=1 Tax=Brachionus plicatilis TaxID=10195 RepID=A0A3M7SXS3_BRAPC|nr:hypothetical protein BpHYR1_027335 [Brachionus plicatilis]